MGLLLASQVMDTISNTFSNIFSGIGTAISNNAVVVILCLTLLLILIVYRTIRNRFTTESLTYRAITKLNEYLARNPFITEDNLVEFNRLMMNSPKTIRFQWQRYIVNREKKPSEFLSEENVITRPVRTNSYKQGLKSFIYAIMSIATLAVILLFSSHIVSLETKPATMLLSLVIPGFILLIGLIYSLFSNILYNAIMSDLYFSYTNFEKNIDRAVINMPVAIDYEIIFTPKEIQNGIPALQEFLEQRAIYEEEQLQKAKESEVEHETYDFDSLGVNGSLVMQRAIKESESYLGNRRRLLAEIETIQTEKDSVQKDFDEENKTYQRNLRDIREEIAKLKSKIETVTNEITRSALRRQQLAEVEKEQNIEREIEKATSKFNKKIDKLNEEIEKKNKEIDEIKVVATKSLTSEFKHFSDQTYKELKIEAENEVQDKINNLINDKAELALALEEKDKIMSEKLALYEEKVNNFDSLANEVDENRSVVNDLKDTISSLNQDIESKNQEIFEVRQELESRKKELAKKDEMIENFKKKKSVEVYRYFDANGNEFYFDENERPYYLDQDGNAVYYDDYSDDYQANEETEVESPEENLYDDTESLATPEYSQTEENELVNESIEDTNEQAIAEEVTSEEIEKPKKKRGRKPKKQATELSLEEPVQENVETETKMEKVDETEPENVIIENNVEPESVAEITQEKVTENEGETEGYQGIQHTLDKLARAAEEKLKQEKELKSAEKENNKPKTTKKTGQKKASNSQSSKKTSQTKTTSSHTIKRRSSKKSKKIDQE